MVCCWYVNVDYLPTFVYLFVFFFGRGGVGGYSFSCLVLAGLGGGYESVLLFYCKSERGED